MSLMGALGFTVLRCIHRVYRRAWQAHRRLATQHRTEMGEGADTTGVREKCCLGTLRFTQPPRGVVSPPSLPRSAPEGLWVVTQALCN